MEKLYLSIIYFSYTFLYFLFCSLLTRLLLEKVLSRVASKNKQNIPTSSSTKSNGEKLIAGYIYFHITWSSFKYSTYFFGLLFIQSLKYSSISAYCVFQGSWLQMTKQWVDTLLLSDCKQDSTLLVSNLCHASKNSDEKTSFLIWRQSIVSENKSWKFCIVLYRIGKHKWFFQTNIF